jgi:hypothetical protein
VTYNVIDQQGIFEMGFWWKKWFSVVLIMLVFLISTVHALEYDEITIDSDKEWMTAGGNPALIEVAVNNESVSVQSVDFSLSGTGSSGTFTVSSDTASPWKTDFSSEESGIAYVQVTVNYIEDGYTGSVTKEFQQNIDHDVMDSLATVDYEYEATVNEAFPIIISAVDRYGNLIDSRREDDTGETPESFELISSPVSSEFWDGSDFTKNTVRVHVNSTGYAGTQFRVSEIAGTNFVSVYPLSDVDSTMIEITGLANAEPADIAVIVSPASGDPPYQPADGVSKFYITYQLIDQWGNPSGNRQLYIEPTDPGESSFNRTSNSAGKIEITYGPQVIKGIYTLIATSVDNTSISEETDLEFVSTDPTDMLLTANPQVMPSHDVDDTQKSALRAKVIDEKGNPVMGETVTFSIINGDYPDSQLAGPYLESTSAVSDQDGQAIISFIPGTFETDWDALNYSKTADASCQVRAQWNTTTRYIDLEWKNYPYLTVKTNVTPETVKVNDTVTVTIQLIGDGWALQPDPIDVVLVADRSGSMLMDYPDRMVSLMDALEKFGTEMKEGWDRLGLASFGTYKTADIMDYSYKYWAGSDSYWGGDDLGYICEHYTGNGKYYGDYATLDLELTEDFSDYNAEVEDLVPYGGTPMRKGLYYSIKHVRDNAREDAVKAVVILSDGDYNYYGDPLARGSGSTIWNWGNMQDDYYTFTDLNSSEQDMRVFANANGIKIFSIAYADGISSQCRAVLQTLAEDTGGKYYYAPKGDALADIYKDIAGELKEAAGVDTSMELMFQDVEINKETLPNTDDDPILEYVYDPGKSTFIENIYGNGMYTSESEDQSVWWAENRSLHFDVGTVYLNQTWQATYILKIMKAGNINLFNDTSYISFNGGEDLLELPDTYVTSVADLNSTGVNFTTLDISGLKNTNSGSITNTIDLEWNLDYDGEYTVSQNLYYLRIGDNVWIHFNTITVSEPASSLVQTSSLPVVDLPPGQYRIRVIASASDAADDKEEISSPIPVKSSADAYIKIE